MLRLCARGPRPSSRLYVRLAKRPSSERGDAKCKCGLKGGDRRNEIFSSPEEVRQWHRCSSDDAELAASRSVVGSGSVAFTSEPPMEETMRRPLTTSGLRLSMLLGALPPSFVPTPASPYYYHHRYYHHRYYHHRYYGYRYYHHRHRHCWWHHGYRRCMWRYW